MTTLLGQKHEAYCGRIGGPVTLENGLCPECGWRDHDPKSDPGLQIGPGQTGLDEEVAELVWAMNRLPGIKTQNSCSGHRERPFYIWFDVTDFSKRGLLTLSRTLSHNYGPFSEHFRIVLDHRDTDPQVCFRLESKDDPDELYDDAFWDDVYEDAQSMAAHLNALVDDTIDHWNILYDRRGGGC